MTKQGLIAGDGIAHRVDTEYLKSIPDGSENSNLGNRPSISPFVSPEIKPSILTASISRTLKVYSLIIAVHILA